MNNLNIKINNANQYTRNAEGKDTVYIEGVSLEDIDSYKIKNNNLIISLKQGKTITLFNIDDIRYLKTTETSGETLTLMNTLVDNKSNIMDSPTSGNQYLGTFYADAITAFDASEVIQAERYKKGKKWKTRYIHTGMGAVINAGDGDDSIIGSKYNDIITAGAGQNAIAFASGDRGTFGNDTVILTKDEMLVLYFMDPEIKYASDFKYSYINDNKDLLITTSKGTVTLVDYAVKKEASLVYIMYANGTYQYINIDDVLPNADLSSYKGTRFDDVIDATNADRVYVKEKYKKNGKWKTRTVATDTGATIEGRSGDDVITGSQYNDTIIGGEGHNTIKVSIDKNFGNDTIHLTNGEALDIKLIGSSTGEIKTPYYMSGQNLVITVMDGDVTRGTITIANFGQLNLSSYGDLKIFGTDGQTPVLDLKNITSNSFKYGEGSNFNYDGTRLNEIVDASEAGDIVTYVTKKAKTRQEILKYRTLKYKVEQHTGIGVTIDTGAGNDIITGSKYNDVIIGGGGSNTVNLDMVNGFGSDVIYLTEGETLTIKMSANGSTMHYLSGQDLVINVKDESQNVKGTLVIKDFGQINYNQYGNLKIVNPDGDDIFDLKSIKTNYHKYLSGENYNYTATNFNETIDASDADRYSYTEIYKKKGKWKTRTVVTNNGVMIYGGKGNDIITGSQYNDTIIGGEGNNTIVLNTDTDFGEDVICLTKGENLKIKINSIYANKDYFDCEFQDNDLHINVYSDGNKEQKELRGTLIIKDYRLIDETANINIINSNGSILADLKTLVSGVNTNIYGGNYTASRFNDEISAENASQVITSYKKKVKGKTKTYYVETGIGVTIDGNDGNDIITGSKYNDVLYGGNGNDTITSGAGNDAIYGGRGNNTLVFNLGDGQDVVYSDNGTDTLYFREVNNLLDINLISNGTDLIIKYSDNDCVILDKYLTNEVNSAQFIKTKSETFSLESFAEIYNLYNESDSEDGFIVAGSGVINGTNKDELIIGSDGDDIIRGNKGNDAINAKGGNNTIYFYRGDGKDVVQSGGGTDTLIFESGVSVEFKCDNDDLIILYGDNNDAVTLKNYLSIEHSVKHVYAGEIEYSIENKFYNISRGESLNSINISTSDYTYVNLKNPFGASNYVYKIESNSGMQTCNLTFLENGRLVIDGNHLDVVANSKQNDDIIVTGNYNNIYTGDYDDIVRISGPCDSNREASFEKTSNNNYINTGSGDDYVRLYGGGNRVDAGNGDDYVSYGKSYTVNASNAENVCAEWSHETNAPDGKIGAYHQGEGPICSTLAFLESLTRYNQLSDYVTIKNYSGSYTVTFNNFHEDGKTNSVTVNSWDLNDYKDVTGDLDVVLTCLGLKKLLRRYGVYSINYETQDSFTNVPKYFFGNNDMTIITGKNKINKLWELYSNKQITNFTIGIFESSMHLSPNYDLGIVTGHAYSVYDMQDDYIALVNPWDNKDILKIDYDTLYSYEVYGYAHGYDSEIVGGSSLVYMPYGGEDMADAGELQYDVASWLADADSSGIAVMQDDKSANVAELVASYVPNDSSLKEFV